MDNTISTTDRTTSTRDSTMELPHRDSEDLGLPQKAGGRWLLNLGGWPYSCSALFQPSNGPGL